MKLTFLGAADTVTGSRSLISFGRQRLLVDCGLFQGPKELRQRNWSKFPVDPSTIDAVYLTHAHLDHSGYLPRLVQEGFAGPIYATSGTTDLCQILLRDAAYLEEEFARYANQSGYSNHKPALPLFRRIDAEKALELFKSVARHQWLPVAQGLSARFFRAGHIPGASYIQFALDGPEPRRLTFTGDLGNDRLITMRAPEPLPPTEVLVIESTYGDRSQPREDVFERLASVIRGTYAKSGVLVIPAFAVGRAQELIYMIRRLEDEGRIPKQPVVLDSPMAIQATRTFLAHPEDHALDPSLTDEDDGFRPAYFEAVATADESMLCTMRDGPMIVISAAGMLSGGRILHHLKRRLPNPHNKVLFTGHQADGTKGRFLQDNAGTLPTLRIHHEEVPVEAEIETLDCLSSHADYDDILAALKAMSHKPEQIILNHGSPTSQLKLQERIWAQLGIRTSCACEIGALDLFEG